MSNSLRFFALEEIKRMHAPVTACAGCHLSECHGDCDRADKLPEDEPRQVAVCGICCWDSNDNARSQRCLDFHDHADDEPCCRTAEIIARAGL